MIVPILDSDKILNDIQEGNLKALEIDLALKLLSDKIKELRSSILSNVIIEAEKYHKEERTLNNHTFSLENRGLKWDYENDPHYASISKQLKEREDVLKFALTLKIPLITLEGEEVKKVPMKNPGSISIVWKNKKE